MNQLILNENIKNKLIHYVPKRKQDFDDEPPPKRFAPRVPPLKAKRIRGDEWKIVDEEMINDDSPLPEPTVYARKADDRVQQDDWFNSNRPVLRQPRLQWYQENE
jgi:hypothetical protein